MSTTKQILNTAANLVSGERQETYGDKRVMHENIAALWNAFLRHKLAPAEKLSARDVAVLMGLMKAGRMMAGAGTEDSYVDAAAYFAIAGEFASKMVADEITKAPRPLIKQFIQGEQGLGQAGRASFEGLENLNETERSIVLDVQSYANQRGVEPAELPFRKGPVR